MTKKLTTRQEEVLNAIKFYIRDEGISPSRDDLAKMFGVYPNAIQCHLNSLQAKGYVRVKPKKSRGIVLL